MSDCRWPWNSADIAPTGFDLNAGRIAELAAGFDTRKSAGTNCCRRKNCSSPPNRRIASCTVFIIAVPTPIDASKRPNFSPLTRASETVARVLKKDDIVIYESTVYPGATEEVCVPILEQVSGLRFNRDFFAATALNGSIPATMSTGLANHHQDDLRLDPRDRRFCRRGSTGLSSPPVPSRPVQSRWPRRPRSSRTPSATSTSP